MTFTVQCPCGNAFPVPVTLTSRPGDRELLVDVSVNEAAAEAQWEWHSRRFHGGSGSTPLTVAA